MWLQVPAVTPCQTLVEAPGSPDYMEALYGHVPKRLGRRAG